MDAVFITATLFLALLGQSVFGFGSGLVAIPLLSLILGVRDAVTLALIFQLLTGLLVLKTYRSLQWRIVAPMLAGLVPGTVAGTYLLASLNESTLRVALAVFILVYLVKEVFFADAVLHGLKHRVWGFVAGALGGTIQGFIGTGGPPLVIYLREAVEGRTAFRAALFLIIMVSNLLRLGISVPAGLFTAYILEAAVVAAPFCLLGLWLGDRLSHRINDRYYGYAVQGLLFCAAVVLLADV